jgi:hypothetical protein
MERALPSELTSDAFSVTGWGLGSPSHSARPLWSHSDPQLVRLQHLPANSGVAQPGTPDPQQFRRGKQDAEVSGPHSEGC